jgi:D-alanine-D-alanine ligase
MNHRETFKKKKIGVLMGGTSPEREISKKTGAAILTALQKKGYTAISIDADSSLINSLQKEAIEIAFIALHGSPGEDGTIQSLLKILNIPYTGSDILSSAISMNKAVSKKIFIYHRLPTPEFQSFIRNEAESGCLQDRITISLPLVIKPSNGGSTIGISIAREKDQIESCIKNAFQHSREIIIEEFIRGREITVGILNGLPLPIVEIRPKNGFYDYESKYTSEETGYIVAPDLGDKKTALIQDMAVNAFNSLGCRGAARVDFIISANGSPFILEINTIPGMTETSLLPMAAEKAGINFENLVEKIMFEAAL